MKELEIQKRLIMTPGPTGVDPRVSKAMGYAVLGQFDPAFTNIMNETMQMIREAFQTKNHWAFPIDGTSRAGLEAVISSIVSKGDRVLVPIYGRFGHLFVELAERAGGIVETIECPWGEVFVEDEIIAAIDRFNPKVVALVHGETSTGRMQPLAKIGAYVRQKGAFLVVDAVATFMGADFKVDQWQVDAVVGGAQKCLSIPSGITPITFNERFSIEINKRKRVEQGVFTEGDANAKNFITSNYFDLTQLQDYWSERRLNHHTEATIMVYALHEGLRLALEEGLQNRFDRHLFHQTAIKNSLVAMGFKIFGDQAHEMPNMTCVEIPTGVDGEKVRALLLQQYGVEISSSFGSMHGKIWRIGSMGYVAQKTEILTFLSIFAGVAAQFENTKLNPLAGVTYALHYYGANTNIMKPLAIASN
jgi:(S)-ureidoglycine-glyoxylate aminotransferase